MQVLYKNAQEADRTLFRFDKNLAMSLSDSRKELVVSGAVLKLRSIPGSLKSNGHKMDVKLKASLKLTTGTVSRAWCYLCMHEAQWQL